MASDGSWQQTGRLQLDSASGLTLWGYSASGVYGYAIAGGSVSGTWQQSGSGDTNYDTATNSTLGGDGAWTNTGSQNTGESGGQAHRLFRLRKLRHSRRRRLGRRHVRAAAAVAESGTDDWGYGYATQAAHERRRHVAAGDGQRRDHGDRVRPVGLRRLRRLHPALRRRDHAARTWQASGGASDGYIVQTVSTLNPDGSWTTTGTASSSGSGSGLWAYSGSGSFSQSTSYGDSSSGGDSSFGSQATEDYSQGWSSQYTVLSTLAANGIGHHRHDRLRLRQRLGQPHLLVQRHGRRWSQTGDYAAGNGSVLGVERRLRRCR